MTCSTHITPTKRTNVVPICQYVHRVKQLNVIASALRFFLIQLNSLYLPGKHNYLHDNKQIGKKMGTAHFDDWVQTHIAGRGAACGFLEPDGWISNLIIENERSEFVRSVCGSGIERVIRLTGLEIIGKIILFWWSLCASTLGNF